MGRNWAIHLTLYDMSWRLEVYFLWLIPFIGIWILQQLVNMFICADGISSWGAMNQFDLLCRTLVCRFAPHSDWSPYHCCFQQISTHGALQLISWGHFLTLAKFKFLVYWEIHYLDLRKKFLSAPPIKKDAFLFSFFFAAIASISKKVVYSRSIFYSSFKNVLWLLLRPRTTYSIINFWNNPQLEGVAALVISLLYSIGSF